MNEKVWGDEMGECRVSDRDFCGIDGVTVRDSFLTFCLSISG